MGRRSSALLFLFRLFFLFFRVAIPISLRQAAAAAAAAAAARSTRAKSAAPDIPVCVKEVLVDFSLFFGIAALTCADDKEGEEDVVVS